MTMRIEDPESGSAQGRQQQLQQEPAQEAQHAPWSRTAIPRWAEDIPVPEFLALREGNVAVIVVAPHGGRRMRPIRPGDSVNDLHTAAIAWELAERLDAHAIVNHALDRNDIDLNRIEHLTTRAPEFLSLLLSSIGHASRSGLVPIVVFVHGWNMVTSCCDIGIGLRRPAGRLTGRFPTLSRTRLETTIAGIERELSARGLSADIGRRYAASGRDNAAQLFSGRHSASENPVVAELGMLSAAGRVDAAQLELGISLRWPGPLRDALIDGLVAALGAASPALPREPDATPPPEPGASLPSEAKADDAMARDAKTRVEKAAVRSGWDLPATAGDEHPDGLEPGYSLQAVLDPDGNVATFCGVEATGPHSMVVRFSLVSTDGSMMLLVAEGSWTGARGRYELDGFSWHAGDGGTRMTIRVRAPVIRYRTHEAYLDLERGLSGSELAYGDIDLVFEATSGEHGTLRGTVRAGDIDLVVETVAFFDRGSRRSEPPRERLRILVATSAQEVTIARSDERTDMLELDRDHAAFGTIRARVPELPFREAEIVARVPVWRPLGQGQASRWTFGIVRCRFQDDNGETREHAGLFDSLEIFSRRLPS
ncbi:MAG TPA: hypothetical protein VN634_02165 [Candidatus Limnocylindrales bacterium]|nr:hypothetical protein [Candidatus Limnocylindrales bacterium]